MRAIGAIALGPRMPGSLDDTRDESCAMPSCPVQEVYRTSSHQRRYMQTSSR